MHATVADITVPNNVRFIAPTNGYLRRLQVMLHGAIATASETISYRINNGTLVTAVVIPTASSAEGTIGTANLYVGVGQGDEIEIENDGASTGAVGGTITVTLSK